MHRVFGEIEGVSLSVVAEASSEDVASDIGMFVKRWVADDVDSFSFESTGVDHEVV